MVSSCCNTSGVSASSSSALSQCNRAHLRRVLFKQHVAAFVFRQGEQFRKETASKQNGTSNKGAGSLSATAPRRKISRSVSLHSVVDGCSWQKARSQGFYRLPAQQGLIPGRNMQPAKVRPLLQQRFQSQPNSIVPAGQTVQQAGNAAPCTAFLPPGSGPLLPVKPEAACP